MLRRILFVLLLMMILLGISGCLSVGPQVRTDYVLVYPGNPIVILENETVLGRPVTAPDTAKPDKFKIGGFVAMPREHFDYLKQKASE